LRRELLGPVGAVSLKMERTKVFGRELNLPSGFGIGAGVAIGGEAGIGLEKTTGLMLDMYPQNK